jgi:hypothetical protein
MTLMCVCCSEKVGLIEEAMKDEVLVVPYAFLRMSTGNSKLVIFFFCFFFFASLKSIQK